MGGLSDTITSISLLFYLPHRLKRAKRQEITATGGSCKQALSNCDAESEASPGLLGVPRPRREKDTTGSKTLPVRAVFSVRECKPVLGLESGSIVLVWPLLFRIEGAAQLYDARGWSSW